VLEVLDPVPQSRSSLNELDLLALFARQAATALRIVVDRGRPADPEPALDGSGRTAARELLQSLQRMLGSPV